MNKQTALPPVEKTWFECISCGGKVGLLDNPTFSCPKCGDLQRVEHDFTYGWNGKFKPNVNPLSPMGTSGVWKYSGKNGIIMPFFPEKYMLTLGEGNEPILEAGPLIKNYVGGDIDLWLMMQGMNPTGSFKDRGMVLAVSHAHAMGVKAIVCVSTGDTSAAAAAYAARAGIDCYVLMTDAKGGITIVQQHQPETLGAKKILIPSDFDKGMETLQKLADQGLIYLVNSRNSLRIEGHISATVQVAESFGWNMPDVIAAPVGNGSDSSSIGQGLRRLQQVKAIKPGTRILGAQVASAAPLFHSMKEAEKEGEITEESWNRHYQELTAGETAASAMNIGNPVSKQKVIHEIIESKGTMKVAVEHELLEAMDFCNRDGLPVCPQTAVALVGIMKARKTGFIKPGQRVVCMSTATQMKFPETLVGYHGRAPIIAKNSEPETIAKLMGL